MNRHSRALLLRLCAAAMALPLFVHSLTLRMPLAADGIAEQPVELWKTGLPVPKSAELLPLEGVELCVIKPYAKDRDGYQWLHGIALTWHKGKLYASFGHNKGPENTATEEARGCVSADGGKTWSDLFTIDEGDEPNLGVSHGVFLSHRDGLWAFHGAFHNKREELHTRAYVLDEATGAWRKKGVVVEGGFWPTQEPQRMADGNWIMAGFIVGNGNPAAVAVSDGDDFMRWSLLTIPKHPEIKMWGESSVIIDGKKIVNIARSGRTRALVAVSADYGRTWTESRPSNLPMATSKCYAGTLSTGQRYLVGTTTADSGPRRSPLTIAVTRPGEQTFSRIFRIRDGRLAQPAGLLESDENARLSYPYAVEHDGRLYVAYSNSGSRGGNHNAAELAIIDVESLRVE